jgi:anti-anti-sigma factor
MSSSVSSTTGSDFELSVEADLEDLVLRLSGDFDVAAASTVLTAVEAGVAMDGCRRLVFELSQVRFVDSAGIGLLIRAAMLQAVVGGAIIVRNPSEAVRRLLELIRFTDLLPMESDLAR